MTPNDKVLGFIRTYIPYWVGAGVAWLYLTIGLDLGGETEVALVAFTIALVTNGYYLLLRLLEVRFPWMGAFLGYPKTPDYTGVDNLWASLIRTGVPTIVSAVVVTVAAWLSGLLGFAVDVDTQLGVIAVAVAIVEAAYYGLARAILAKWPGAAWLLGTPAVPSYPVRGAAPRVA